MNNSRGFLLIETAAVFLLAGILLLGALKLYGSGIRLQQKKQQLQQSWQAVQQWFYCGESASDWQIQENVTESENLKIKEVRIVDDEGKICGNLVWVEK